MEETGIAEFYNGKTVFITGATGFMGKVLVEKLLRSCPGVDQLYLLMRPSKGKDVTSRLQEFIDNQVTDSKNKNNKKKNNQLLLCSQSYGSVFVQKIVQYTSCSLST